MSLLGDRYNREAEEWSGSEVPAKPVYTLNMDQQASYDWLVPFATERYPKVRMVLLEGWAGTGKTFVTNRVVEAVKAKVPGIGIGMTAPTHKAVRNLKKHSELKHELDFGTIHSFLGLVQKIVKDPKDSKKMIISYEIDWNSGKARRIDEIHLLIVDEASMLDDVLFEHIEDALKHRPTLRVIFMGDGLQIPPVGNQTSKGKVRRDQSPDAIPFSPAQRSSRGIHHLLLNQIVRQGLDNPIIAYSKAIREQIEYQTIKYDFKWDETSGVEPMTALRNLAGMRELLRKYFCTPEFERNSDYVKVVAWRNETCRYFNHEIRLMINKAEILPFLIDGDRLVMEEPLVKNDRMILAKNEELRVISHEIGNVSINYKMFNLDQSAFDRIGDNASPRAQVYTKDIKIYIAKVKTEDEDKELFLQIIHEDSLTDFDAIRQQTAAQAMRLENYERKEMWSQFYKLPAQFAMVGHNYCLTAHKSQGSTYDHVISMEWDIEQNRDFKERNRIRYVAITRARYKGYVIR